MNKCIYNKILKLYEDNFRSSSYTKLRKVMLMFFQLTGLNLGLSVEEQNPKNSFTILIDLKL